MKTICLMTTALALVALPTHAEMVTGEIISVQDNIMTVQNQNGQQMSFQTNDDTTYRKKSMPKHHKKKRGKRGPSEWIYEPIAEEDDWVEITYNPETKTGDLYEVDSITVYDD